MNKFQPCFCSTSTNCINRRLKPQSLTTNKTIHNLQKDCPKTNCSLKKMNGMSVFLFWWKQMIKYESVKCVIVIVECIWSTIRNHKLAKRIWAVSTIVATCNLILYINVVFWFFCHSLPMAVAEAFVYDGKLRTECYEKRARKMASQCPENESILVTDAIIFRVMSVQCAACTRQHIKADELKWRVDSSICNGT